MTPTRVFCNILCYVMPAVLLSKELQGNNSAEILRHVMDVNRDPLGPGAVPKMLPCSLAVLGFQRVKNPGGSCDSLHRFPSEGRAGAGSSSACLGLSAPFEPSLCLTPGSFTSSCFASLLVWRGDAGQRTAVNKPGPFQSYQDTVRRLPGKSDGFVEDSDNWYWYLVWLPIINSGSGVHRALSCGLC